MLATRLGAVDPKEILYALDLMGAGPQSSAAHPAVRGLLDHAEAGVRCRALSLLSEAGDLSVLPRAEQLLHDPALEVRTEALLYLSRHAHIDPLSRVRELADFPDYSVRSAVVAVLARLGDGRARGGGAAVRRDGGRGRRAGTAHAAGSGAARRTDAAAVRGVAAAAGAGRGRGGRTHGDPRRGARRPARLRRPADRTAGRARRSRARRRRRSSRPQRTPWPRSRRRSRTGGCAPATRRAIPGVLERIGGEGAIEVLTDNLLDGDAALRLRILAALAAARDLQADLPIDARLLESALGAEVLGHYRSYQVLGTILAPGPGQEPIERGLRAAMREELERVFRLLDLIHPRRDFRAAWLGLQSGNAVIHDQALDLLDSLLRARDEGAPGPARRPRDPRAAAGEARPSAGRRAGRYARAGHRSARLHRRSLAALLRGLRDRLARARDARPPPRGVARRPRPAAARDRAPGARPAFAAAPRRLKGLTTVRSAIYVVVVS